MTTIASAGPIRAGTTSRSYRRVDNGVNAPGEKSAGAATPSARARLTARTGRADALHGAALRLALDDARVDLVPGVVNRVIAEYRHRAGLRIDLDGGHVDAGRPGHALGTLVARGREPGLAERTDGVRSLGQRRELGE